MEDYWWYISHLWVGGHWTPPTHGFGQKHNKGKYGCYECNEELHIFCIRHPLLGNDSIPTFKGKGHARQNNCWQCICDLYFLYIYIYIIFFLILKFFSIQIWLGCSSWENAKEIALPWIPTLEIQLLNAKSFVITQIEAHNQSTNLSIAPAIMVIYVEGWIIIGSYLVGMV